MAITADPPTHPCDPADVRDRVRSLYETHPYPPPVADLDAIRDRRESTGGSPLFFFHQYWPSQPFRDDLDVLVAGCGTSQAAKYAIEQPNLRVTGIDLCERSLAETQTLIDRYDLRNLRLHRLPIERVGELDQTFDLVISTGVLHHLPDPDAGLWALRTALRPEGAMHLAVYAPYGRTGVYMMQAYCRRLGLGPTSGAIGSLVDVVLGLAPDHPLSTLVRGGCDFNTPTGVADALLHPQDRAYSVPEVYDWLERCGMRFVRWQHQAAYLPSCAVAETMPHRAALDALPAHDQHAAMELLTGTMYLHTFVACRDDRAAETFVIDFDGGDWRSFVPARFEGARARHEDGKTVLENVAHKDPNLGLSLTAPDLALVQSVDGERSLGQIAAGAASAGIDNADEHTRTLFRRLWQCDLVMMRVGESEGGRRSDGAGGRGREEERAA